MNLSLTFSLIEPQKVYKVSNRYFNFHEFISMLKLTHYPRFGCQWLYEHEIPNTYNIILIFRPSEYFKVVYCYSRSENKLVRVACTCSLSADNDITTFTNGKECFQH